MITLWASTRRGGRSLAEIARSEIGPVAGTTAIIADPLHPHHRARGPRPGVVNALAESAWGIFTIGATIPIAIFMGFYMFVWRKGQIKEATAIGVTLMFLGVDLRQERRRVLDRPLVRDDASSDHDRDGPLRTGRRDAAGLDAADAARVPQHLHEDRHHPVPGVRRDASSTRTSRRRRSRSTSAAAGPSSPVRCSRSCSSRSRAAPSPGSTP